MDKVDRVLVKNSFLVRSESAQKLTFRLMKALNVNDGNTFLKICEGGHRYFHRREYTIRPVVLYWYFMASNTKIGGLDQDTFAMGVRG